MCFPCAMETPDREAEAKANFDVLFDTAEAIGPVAAIGTSAGPQPFDPRLDT